MAHTPPPPPPPTSNLNPRELTQNPLKKIWMPCKNGLPERHISQRKGTYGVGVASDKLLLLLGGGGHSFLGYVSPFNAGR
uniref:Uncharacterized protein n=1 Tax=Hippocampus comes TaxID=109280 RepID=A0A3Q3E2I5_HIPCM